MKVKELISYEDKSKIRAGDATLNGKYPFFTSSESEDKRYDQYTCDAEGIIMGTGGNATLHYYNGKFAVSTDCLVLKTNQNVKCKYLYYFFKANMKVLQDGFKGAGLKHTNKNYIENIELNKLPNITEQLIIIGRLDKINNIIQKHKKMINYLDTLIKARFVEMFGKKMENDEVMLSDIAEFVIGLTYKPENVSKNGTIVLRSGNILNNSLQLNNDVVRVSNVSIPKNKYIKNNDILMCSRNGSARLVGKSCLISDVKEDMSFGAFMTVIRSEYPYFLQSFFSSQYFTRQLTSVATTSVNQITTYMLNGYKTIKPTDDEENSFATFVKHIDKLKVA